MGGPVSIHSERPFQPITVYFRPDSNFVRSYRLYYLISTPERHLVVHFAKKLQAEMGSKNLTKCIETETLLFSGFEIISILVYIVVKLFWFWGKVYFAEF